MASITINARHRWILGALLLALALRLLWVLALDRAPDQSGGDANWYMENGQLLVTEGKNPGPLPTAPLYLVFLGIIQVVVPGEPTGQGVYYTYTEMQTARAIQAAFGALLVLFAYWIAQRLFAERAARLAAIILAISPALILEAGGLATESMFLMFVAGGLALYVRAQDAPTARQLVGVGVVFGLATLTRAVFLLFPVGIALHILLTRRLRWRRLAAALLISYALMNALWTVYNIVVWERLIIGSEGMTGNLLLSAIGDKSPEDTDQQLGITGDSSEAERDAALREQAQDRIMSDPVGWAAHRIKDLTKAYLQPHNTVQLGDESLRDAAVDWLRADRSLDGLRALAQGDGFWPKLALYVFHFGGLALGAVGMVWVWRQRRAAFALYGMAIYFTGIHLALLALPRYLFPLYPVFWIFGAAALARLGALIRSKVQAVDLAHLQARGQLDDRSAHK